DDMAALILATGRIRLGEHTGSIHQVARVLQEGPANGWRLWYYDDPESGERREIDVLREQVRRQMR
ncbi:MAG TPA: hypothetical protein PK801_06150, partial [Aggregatilineales bacterium]|nr:hypothetical protein [Aggregatilineales bacterium]